MPLSEEDLAYIHPRVDYILKHYEKSGCKIETCSHCGLLIDIIWPNHPVSGPSLSSIQFCRCEGTLQSYVHKMKGE